MQSATAEIRRGKKEEEERRKKDRNHGRKTICNAPISPSKTGIGGAPHLASY